MWRHGSHWLTKEFSEWFALPIPNESLLEVHKQVVLKITKVNNTLLIEYSNITNLTRIMAYLLRLINNCIKNNVNRKGILYAEEIYRTNHCIIKLVQKKLSKAN
jgi:hypothetical protein